MTVSPRKRVSIVGTRSLRGGKVTVTEEDWEAGSSYTFKGSPELSPNKDAIKKKASPKAKGRRKSLLLKRLEIQNVRKTLSPIISRRARRTSMINTSSQKTVVTETTKIVHSTSDTVLPTRGRPRSKPSNKTTASKALPPKAPASKTSTPKSPPVQPASPSSPKEPSPKKLLTRGRPKSKQSIKTTASKIPESPPVKLASPSSSPKEPSPTKLPTRGRPRSKPSKKTTASKIPESPPVKLASPSPKEPSPKKEVSTKVTVRSANTTKVTKTVSKTSTRRSSAIRSPLSKSPKATSPMNTKVSIKATAKSTKTAKTTKVESKNEAKYASPETAKAKIITFSPVKFYSSPQKSATPSKRKSFIMSVDQDVSFNYSPVADKKRKFDGTPTPEADSVKKSKKRKIDKSSVRSKLPILEKKDAASKETPKSTKSGKATRSKDVVKTPKEETSTKSPKQAPKSEQLKTPKESPTKSPILGRKSAKKLMVVISPYKIDAKSPKYNNSITTTPETMAKAAKSDKKSTVKKTPESRKSIKRSAKKPTPSPKVSQQKKLGLVTKTTKKVKISATSPEGAAIEYRKTPKSDKQRKSVVSDVGSSPELNSAVELLATIRASPIKSKPSKLKPFTPRPDPTPSRVLKQTMKKKAAKDLQTLKNIKMSSLVDSELVVMKSPVQLTRTPLRKTSAVRPETPSSASNLPPTPTSSRKTLQAKRSVAKRELNMPSPPRSSTPIEGESSPEPQIADPDVTDINDDVHIVQEISATITTTEIITTEVTSTGIDGEINGITTAIVSEEKTAIVSGDNVSMSSSDLNGSALAVANDSQENPPSKSRWRYCSVM